MSNTKPRRLLTAFLAVNVLFGTVFAGMAAGSALALDESAPTETTEPTVEPTVEPTAAPVDREPRRVARAATLNADGSTTIEWDNGLRDEADPNFSSFQNLSFTVSKSTNLTYEIINVSWEGDNPPRTANMPTTTCRSCSAGTTVRASPTPETANSE